MVRRGLIVAPVLIAICGVIWGMDGAWSGAYGIALILLNFAIAAGLIGFTARISLGLMMGAVLFGYLLRLGLSSWPCCWSRTPGGFRCRRSERPSSSRTSACSCGR